MESSFPVGYSALDVPLDDNNGYWLPSSDEGEKGRSGFGEVEDSEAGLLEGISDIQDVFDPELLYACGLNDKGRPRSGEISDSEAGLMDGVTEADLFCEFKPGPPETKTVMTWPTAPFQSAKKGSLIKRCGSDLSGDSEDSTAVSSGASSSIPTVSATGMSATTKDLDFQTGFYALSDFHDDDEKSISPLSQSEILAQSNRVGLYRSFMSGHPN